MSRYAYDSGLESASALAWLPGGGSVNSPDSYRRLNSSTAAREYRRCLPPGVRRGTSHPLPSQRRTVDADVRSSRATWLGVSSSSPLVMAASRLVKFAKPNEVISAYARSGTPWVNGKLVIPFRILVPTKLVKPFTV